MAIHPRTTAFRNALVDNCRRELTELKSIKGRKTFSIKGLTDLLGDTTEAPDFFYRNMMLNMETEWRQIENGTKFYNENIKSGIVMRTICGNHPKDHRTDNTMGPFVWVLPKKASVRKSVSRYFSMT